MGMRTLGLFQCTLSPGTFSPHHDFETISVRNNGENKIIVRLSTGFIMVKIICIRCKMHLERVLWNSASPLRGLLHGCDVTEEKRPLRHSFRIGGNAHPVAKIRGRDANAI